MQWPITVTGGSVVEDDGVIDVDVVDDVLPGTGAPVEKRQPAPGGLNASMLTSGGGRFSSGAEGCVVVVGVGVGVVGVVGPLLVVGPDAVVVAVECTVVVGSAEVEWRLFSWKPTMMSAETQSPSTTLRGHLGRAPSRVDSLGI